MTNNDIVLAFFPCTRFEAQILLHFRGDAVQQKNWTDIEKLENDLKLHKELSENYELITKLAIICLKKHLKLIFENPYSEQHYLTRYWCLKPAIIDRDRTQNGDIYKKPTQYWFIGCEPQQNLVFRAIDYVETRNISKIKWDEDRARKRSEITPQYAKRFIEQYILEVNNKIIIGE